MSNRQASERRLGPSLEGYALTVTRMLQLWPQNRLPLNAASQRGVTVCN